MARSDKWDVVTFYPMYTGGPLKIDTLATGNELVVYLYEIASTAIYVINRDAARRYLARALPIQMAIDHMYVRDWEFGIRILGVENPRLSSHGHEVSLINSSEKTSTDPYTISERVYRGLFKLQTYVMRFLYNFKVYLELKFAS